MAEHKYVIPDAGFVCTFLRKLAACDETSRNQTAARTTIVQKEPLLDEDILSTASEKCINPDTQSTAMTGSNVPDSPSAKVPANTYVVVAFWALVLFFGLPVWWKTTTVHREAIPLDEMQDWASGKVSTAKRRRNMARFAIYQRF